MCGIAGIVRLNGEEVQGSLLKRMGESIRHRGPDDHGIYANRHVGFAHRRLSVIDLCGGHQPMCNPERTVWIIYNGEVYNYLELRRLLEQKGCHFKTHSDTEVILRLYEKDGVDCVRQLNGMFAFAIWDEVQKRLFLARDRLGVKPLYYCMTGDSFLFASEIKAILEDKSVSAVCNETRIPEYLLFRCIAGQETLFKGIFSLLPGNFLLLEGKQISIRQYWDLDSYSRQAAKDEQHVLTHLRDLLSDSIRLRLRSDVPVGTFCSGGVDSSLVTAMAALTSASVLNTFSVGFEEKDYNETQYARLISKKYHTNHHELIVSHVEFADVLPKMIWYNDEPLNHPNSVQLYFISRYAKELVTVILTGEGADELLGGYPRYFIPLLVWKHRKWPLMARRLTDPILRLCLHPRLQKLRNGLAFDPINAVIYNSSTVNPLEIRKLTGEVAPASLSYRERFLAGTICDIDEYLQRLFMLELKTYLVSILNRQDKMTMAAGIEAREPFLDYRLVEFCMSLPYFWKLNRFRSKYILKKLAKDFLPPKVVDRKKSGFGVPISSWLLIPRGLGRYIPLLQDKICAQRGYFNQVYLNEAISTHLSGKKDYGEILWSLINFELWHRLFIDRLSDSFAALSDDP